MYIRWSILILFCFHRGQLDIKATLAIYKKQKQCVVFKQVKNFIDTPVRNITEGEFKVVLINCGANVF